jgi:hypothetical protein
MDVWNWQKNLRWDVWNPKIKIKNLEIECMEWEFQFST